MVTGTAYARVHLLWTIPPALFLWYSLRRIRTWREVIKTNVLIAIAVVIWTYPPESTIGLTFFSIPLEEVFFFFIQTYITSCIYAALSRPVIHAVLLPRFDHEGRWVKLLGTAALLIVAIGSARQLFLGGPGTYLALILVWVSPFLALLWAVASTHILALPLYASALPILLPTLYLWILDSVALRRGTWVIENGTKLGLSYMGLEIEEAIFFLATNTLIVFGLIACDYSLAIHDAYPQLYPLRTSSSFPSVFSVLRSVLTPPSAYPLERLADLQDALSLLRDKSKSFYVASIAFEGKLQLDLLSLYSWCRVADDLVDEAATREEAVSNVALLTTYLDFVYSNRKSPSISSEKTRIQVDDLLVSLPPSSQSAFRLLATLDIPRAPLDQLLAGFKNDLLFSTSPPTCPIKSDDDLKVYASEVASSIAELCVRLVWSNEGFGRAATGEEQERVMSSAREMGIALQLVNIARDVPADLKNGRVYLPNVALDIDVSSTTPERRRILDIADDMYIRSAPLIGLLPPTASGGILAACAVYSEIGRAVREALDQGDVECRARVSRWRRVCVAWQSLGKTQR